jgi:CHAT domain-containing protein
MSSAPAAVEVLVQQLADEPHPLRRHRLLRAAQPLWAPETVSQLYAESGRLIHLDLKKADRLARSAAWLAAKLGDDAARAEGLRATGHIKYLKGKYQAACKDYDKALAIYERLGRETEVGRTLNGALQCLSYMGRYEDALRYAERAREIFTRQGDRLRLARLDTNLGNIMFRQDRFEDALRLYRQSYDTFLEMGSPQDVGVLLKNMATLEIFLNDFQAALDIHRRARSFALEQQMPLLAAGADYNIAYVYYLRGEYTRSLEMYRAAREHCHALGDTYRGGLCDLDQSEMYLELNLSEEAAHLARRALIAFRQLGLGYESAKALTNLAIAASHHGNSALALVLFRNARELFEIEQNRAWMAIIDLYQALVIYGDKRLAEAQLLCERALEFFSNSPLSAKAALSQLLLARIHLDAGRKAEAKAVCLKVLHRLEPAETPALIYQAYFVLGTIEEALGDRKSATEAYHKAHEQLENLRSHLKAEEMKIAFLKDKLEVYESLVHMCVTGGGSVHDRESAFVYIEQAKSRSLADLIAFRAADLPASTHSQQELVDRIGRLREELNWYNRSIQLHERQTPNRRDPRLDTLDRGAREREQSLVEAMADLRVQDQELANLQAAGSVDVEAVRSVLPDGAMLLQYYRVRDVFHACLLSRGGLDIVPLGPAPDVRRGLQLLRFQLSKFRFGADYVRTFQSQLLDATRSHLQDFYDQLIRPIESRLHAGHLIVAPHDFLHYLPFHALLDGDVPLDARYSISYTPSASVFYLCHTRTRESGDGALVLGVPDPAAPHIVREVDAVASVFPGAEVYVGEAASYEVLRQRGSRARFVHIATHGSFRRDNPMFSSIHLGDSELSLFDLYQLRLPAELVTLSGCGTGLNVVVGGDELIGLKRGLLYAGANGVLLTLWDVHDQSTAAFMQLFYGRLRTDANKARAVQYAMHELRREYPHPFYWAPFVLIGKYV